MGTFIISFIGNSFIVNTIDSQVRQRQQWQQTQWEGAEEGDMMVEAQVKDNTRGLDLRGKGDRGGLLRLWFQSTVLLDKDATMIQHPPAPPCAAISAAVPPVPPFTGTTLKSPPLLYNKNNKHHQLVSMVFPNRDGRRRTLVVIYFAAIIAFITLFGVLTIPDIVREGADFIRRLKSDNVWVILVEKMRQGLG